MDINLIIANVLKIVENKSFQKGFACFVFGVLCLVLGYTLAPKSDYVIEDVCEDYIDDIGELEDQIKKARKKCLEQNAKALKDLSEKLESSCVHRISEAIDHCEFSPEIHCPICVARGECK